MVVVALAGVVTGCGATNAGPKPTVPHPEGLADVRSPACTKDQLRHVSRGTLREPIHTSGRPGFLNTHRTAVKIKLNTLLVVTAKKRDTGYLAVSAGCWVKRESHVKRGVMTVVFLMNRPGYPILEHQPPLPAEANHSGEDTYLHVSPALTTSRR